MKSLKINEKVSLYNGVLLLDNMYLKCFSNCILVSSFMKVLFLFCFPASRTKLMVSSKIRGGARAHAYPQPEGTLGEAMVKFGKDLGEESPFGKPRYFHLSYFNYYS